MEKEKYFQIIRDITYAKEENKLQDFVMPVDLDEEQELHIRHGISALLSEDDNEEAAGHFKKLFSTPNPKAVLFVRNFLSKIERDYDLGLVDEDYQVPFCVNSEVTEFIESGLIKLAEDNDEGATKDFRDAAHLFAKDKDAFDPSKQAMYVTKRISKLYGANKLCAKYCPPSLIKEDGSVSPMSSTSKSHIKNAVTALLNEQIKSQIERKDLASEHLVKFHDSIQEPEKETSPPSFLRVGSLGVQRQVPAKFSISVASHEIDPNKFKVHYNSVNDAVPLNPKHFELKFEDVDDIDIPEETVHAFGVYEEKFTENKSIKKRMTMADSNSKSIWMKDTAGEYKFNIIIPDHQAKMPAEVVGHVFGRTGSGDSLRVNLNVGTEFGKDGNLYVQKGWERRDSFVGTVIDKDNEGIFIKNMFIAYKITK